MLRLLIATGANALYVLLIQVVALLSLNAESFGKFSVQYLAFALASSISLSFISESWTRTDLRGGGRSSWVQYSAVSVYLSCAAAAASAVLSFAVGGEISVALVGCIAVGASAYRLAARYFMARTGGKVLGGDVLGLGVSLVVWGGFTVTESMSLLAVTTIWATGALAACTSTPAPTILSPSVVFVWYRRHRESIRPLMRDSLLMDMGAIGTPYMVLPLLGLAQFGIFRAVSNLSAPSRLLLTPIRPQLMSMPLARQRRVSVVAGVVVIAALIGAFVYILLLAAGAINSLGVIADLSAFALPVAIYVVANSVGSYYMIVARGHLDSRPLLFARLFHTLIAIVLPIAGAILGGLAGAIWGYVACTILWAAVWAALVLIGRGPQAVPGINPSRVS